MAIQAGKPIRVSCAMTKEHYDTISDAAKKSGLGMSAFLRFAALEYVKAGK
jgi:hypothetical protein